MSVNCPQCQTSGLSVPGLVSRGTQNREGLSVGFLSGEMFGSGQDTSFSGTGLGLNRQTTRSQLVEELGEPNVCPDDYRTDAAMFWGIFKVLSIPVMVVLGLMGLIHEFSPLAPDTVKHAVAFAILWGGLGLLTGLAHAIAIPSGRRKAAAIHAQHTWEAARHANWEQLRYCERDHLVFDPHSGHSEIATASGMYRLLRRITP